MKNKLNNILLIIPHDFISFIGCVLVIVGMYISRAMISIGMITLLFSAIVNVKLRSNFKWFMQKPHLVLLTGYFLIFGVSFFWSSNTNYFSERMQIMLPFLILPFSFFSMHRWQIKWYDALTIIFITLNFAGILWSSSEYFLHQENYDNAYHFSKLIPTPFKNDHIRFSLSVVMSICFCAEFFIRNTKPFLRIFLLFLILIDILYLHILAAKTGVIAFYLVAIIAIIQVIFSTKFRKLGIASLFLLIILPFVMYAILPSFKNKIGYIKYSIFRMQNNEKETNISDEGRIISYQYALQIIKENPLIGVGLGDVFDEMKKKYDSDFQNKDVVVLLPHNQFLMAGVAIGIFGILYLLIIQISIYKLVRKNDFLYLSFCIIMLFAMMIEPLYETQYGTCLFLFFLLLLMKRSKYYLA